MKLPAVERRNEPASLATLLEGIRFVRSKPVVLGAISLDLFAVLFGGATALLPAFAADVLHVGPEGLGILRTAPAVGAGLTAAALAAFPITHSVGRWMFAGVATFGCATIVFGLSQSFALSLGALALREVRLRIWFRVRNRFAFPISIRGGDFTLDINDARFGQSSLPHPIELAAHGVATTEVGVAATHGVVGSVVLGRTP